MTWQRSGQDGACTMTGGPTQVSMKDLIGQLSVENYAATGSFRRFYFGGGSAIYDFTYVRACPTGSFTLPFSGASWFSAGVNGAHVPPDGATMQGTFTDGGQTYTWRLTALRE